MNTKIVAFWIALKCQCWQEHVTFLNVEFWKGILEHDFDSTHSQYSIMNTNKKHACMVIVTKRNSALENKLWNWLKRISTRHLIIFAENLKEVVPAPAKFAMGYSHFLQHVKQTIMLFDSIGAHVSSIVFPIRPGLFFLLWFLPCRSSVKKFEWRIDFLQKLITEQNLAAAFW